MIPDAEAIVTAYLSATPELGAFGATVCGSTPEETRDPWVRLTQLDARDSRQGLEWLITYPLQLDCYAGADGGKPQASDLARTVRAALHAMPSAGVAGAVVTKVSFVSMPYLPDPDFAPARPRYALTALVWMHPA